MQSKVNTYRLSSPIHNDYGRAVLFYYDRISPYIREFFTRYEVSGYTHNGGEHTLELILTYERLRDFLFVLTSLASTLDEEGRNKIIQIISKLMIQVSANYVDLAVLQLFRDVCGEPQVRTIAELVSKSERVAIVRDGSVAYLLVPRVSTLERTRFTSSGFVMMDREEYSNYVERLLKYVW